VVVHPVHEDLLHPPLVHMGIRSLLGVRLLNDDRVIGVLHVGTLADRRFTDEEINLLQLVANQASDAAQARLSGIERAATLSRYPAGPPCSICHPTSRSVLEPPRDDIALLTAAAPRPTSPGTA
jgi:hypothetical protein